MTLAEANPDTLNRNLERDDHMLRAWYTNKIPHSGCDIFEVERQLAKNVVGTLHSPDHVDRQQDYHRPIGEVVAHDFIVPVHSGTIQIELEVREYHDMGRTFFIVDFMEPEDEFPNECQSVIRELRDNGRPVLANTLFDIVRDMQDELLDYKVAIVSLRDMARFLIEDRTVVDPIVGPDGKGIMYAQWEITDGGDLILGFPGYGEIILVAQRDEDPNVEELDISDRGPQQRILEKYGYLVPRRPAS